MHISQAGARSAAAARAAGRPSQPSTVAPTIARCERVCAKKNLAPHITNPAKRPPAGLACCCAAVLQTGCADIVVGHEDGALEVWDVDPQGQPQLMASAQLPESITSVAGGYVTNAGSPDIIVHTFTGKVWVARGHWTAVGMRARV